MLNNSVEPIRVKLRNGEEAEFLLLMSGLRRLNKKTGVKSVKDLLLRDSEEAYVPILFEAWGNKPEGATEESLADQLVANVAGLTEIVTQLLTWSFPEATTRPPVANPVQ